MKPTILTNTGEEINLTAPGAHSPGIEEIAHALSHICRFTGHTRRFYSVAQHSVLVSLLVPEEHARAALLHDAAEAYLGDVASPLKRLLGVAYTDLETWWEKRIAAYHGVQYPWHKSVHEADAIVLRYELRDLLQYDGSIPSHRWVPEGYRIIPLDPHQARSEFLRRYKQL